MEGLDTTAAADTAPQAEPGAAPDAAAALQEPIPPPYTLNGQGRPVPLQGVEPVFLTGGTVSLLGLHPPAAADGAAAPQLVLISVSRDKLLADIQVGAGHAGSRQLRRRSWPRCSWWQLLPSPATGGGGATRRLTVAALPRLCPQFRGAISDFHALKSKIQAADCDTLVLRYLEEDVYGEGCNYEVRRAADRHTLAAGGWPARQPGAGRLKCVSARGGRQAGR
jgi:hypothetical protein